MSQSCTCLDPATKNFVELQNDASTCRNPVQTSMSEQEVHFTFSLSKSYRKSAVDSDRSLAVLLKPAP